MNALHVIFILLAITFATCNADDTNLTLIVDGVTYSNVTFGTVTPLSVSIRHSSGIARLPLAKLPPELQQRFGYDPIKAAEWQAAYQKTQAAQKKKQEERLAEEKTREAEARIQEEARLAAEETRKRAEKEEAQQRARRIAQIEEQIGKAPNIDRLNGGFACVARYLSSHLKDPDSVRYIGWGTPKLVYNEGAPFWQVGVKFRARSGFGGYAFGEGIAFIQKDEVVRFEWLEGGPPPPRTETE